MSELQKNEYLLAPGYMIIPAEPMLIYMVLGSSVSVICRDRKRNRSGCCHYLVPHTLRGESPRPVHGVPSILHLIRLIRGDEGKLGDLEAQVFGGGDLPGRTLGKRNTEAAVQLLEKLGVSIVAMDVGGEMGRKLIYNSGTNHVAVIKVDRIRNGDWYPCGGDA
ncbi:MAG: chemotaxis protein CheD [Candidatus Latescibacterota bacterium]